MKTYFKNANLIDGTGDEIQENICIAVENGIIKKILNQTDESIWKESNVVDLSGNYPF